MGHEEAPAERAGHGPSYVEVESRDWDVAEKERRQMVRIRRGRSEGLEIAIDGEAEAWDCSASAFRVSSSPSSRDGSRFLLGLVFAYEPLEEMEIYLKKFVNTTLVFWFLL